VAPVLAAKKRIFPENRLMHIGEVVAVLPCGSDSE
jgi:hypothetical protein